MHYRGCVFIASLASLVVGFCLAMLFIQSYAVSNYMFLIQNLPLATQCYVQEVRTTRPECHGPGCNAPRTTCLHLPLVYKAANGTLKEGFLVKKNIAEKDSKQTCYCENCHGQYVTEGNRTSFQISRETILIKEWTTCFYFLPMTSQSGVRKVSTWVMLNAMLWPTLLFIGGFMGVFFSCLFLQHDQCFQNKQCGSNLCFG